jgi:outer membrane protein assembly factor BamB
VRIGCAIIATFLAAACGSDSGSPGGTGSVGGIDGGTTDAGSTSPGGATDAGAPDGGVPDGGTVDAGPPLPLGGGDWPQFRHDARGGSENPAIFAASEVASLQRATLAPFGESGTFYIYTQAVVSGDLAIYTTAFKGEVIAVDLARGVEAWPRRTLNSQISTNCGGPKQPGFWNSAAIIADIVYAAAPDGNLYALSKADGRTLWSVRIADPSAAAHGEFVQSSPAVSTALNKMFLGVASSEHCDLIAGRMVSVDLGTHTAQRKELLGPGQIGAAVWSSAAVAEDENRVYFTTGNRVGPASAEPYAQAFLAVDPQTLEVLDSWQNPTPLENADFGSSPVLAEGGGLKLIAATSKDGNLYVLRRDRLSAGPVWQTRLAVIDQANHPNEGGDATAGFGSISTPAFAHGTLYAAGGQTPSGDPGSVSAFEPATGRVIWSRPTPGFVSTPLTVAGEILAVVSSRPDGTASWLEIRSAGSGEVLRAFNSSTGSFGGPTIGRGLILWSDALGGASVISAPAYRR